MNLSASHLKRYKEIAVLLWKYGRSDLVKHLQVEPDADIQELTKAHSQAINPEQLVDDLEAMGPTYIKIGQVLAGRPDLLPAEYLTALSRLQDRVKPFPYEDVERIVTAELGVRISKAFSRFDPVPIGSASLGQVHAAALRDGREVVVKVQRPDIRKQVAEDFEVLEQISSFLDTHTELGRRYRFTTVLEEFRLTIQNELNYEREAQNLVILGKNLEDFALLRVPQPVSDYSSRSVLTMDYVQGRKITSISPLTRLDLNGAALANELLEGYLKQVLVDGLFHADPHPGNIFLTDDGCLALLDFGMVGHLNARMQDKLLSLLLAVSESNSADVSDIIINLSEKNEAFDPAAFRRRIDQLMATRPMQSLQQSNIGRSLLDLSRHAVESGLYVPSELTLLGKTLLQLDEVGRILDPNFDPNGSIRRNAAKLLSKRLRKNATQGNLFRSMLEMKNFMGQLPVRLNKIMDAVANSEVEVKVKAVDAKMILEGLQKIANRIASSIILAALIMGASLMMRINTSFQLFGYPGLAILCFLAAGGGGFWLLISIFRQDQKTQENIRADFASPDGRAQPELDR